MNKNKSWLENNRWIIGVVMLFIVIMAICISYSKSISERNNEVDAFCKSIGYDGVDTTYDLLNGCYKIENDTKYIKSVVPCGDRYCLRG